MSRDRPAGSLSLTAASRDAALRPRWLLPLGLLLAAVLAAWLVAAQVLPGPLGLLALLLIAAGAATSGAYWARQRQLERLRESRQQGQLLMQLVGSAGLWQWQTDHEHRLVRLQPPQGAPASSWAAGAFSGAPLWQRFDDAGHTLQARLQSQGPLPDLVVEQAPQREGAPARRFRLRGLPRHDLRGRFCGHLGVAEPLEPEPEPEPEPAAAEARPEAGAASAPAPADPGHELALQALAAEHAAFSYSISHDLRAPIRVVEGFGRILKEDYGAQLDRIGNDHLDRVMSAAARMNHMIDALLALSKLSTQPLARQPVNLSQLAGWVVDELRRHQPERQVSVLIAAGLTTVGDPTLLRLALENLLGNAWKYSAKNPAAEIVFERAEQAGRPVFVVRDNGAGFDMRFADRLFGVFQRLHSASDFAGHGVGLASVRRIIRRHGGEIWAESEVGQGARFYFTLKD
ncbi:MAG: hypothetical protein KBC73_13535 [Burkholderiaceae bacterium]|nr:hypothetical protein [Burkholderiaceae bacterium]